MIMTQCNPTIEDVRNYSVPQMHASPQHNIAPLGNIVNDDDRTDQNWITPSLRIPLVWHPLSTFVFSNYFGGLFVI
jgi:hypothetical protein